MCVQLFTHTSTGFKGGEGDGQKNGQVKTKKQAVYLYLELTLKENNWTDKSTKRDCRGVDMAGHGIDKMTKKNIIKYPLSFS